MSTECLCKYMPMNVIRLSKDILWFHVDYIDIFIVIWRQAAEHYFSYIIDENYKQYIMY